MGANVYIKFKSGAARGQVDKKSVEKGRSLCVLGPLATTELLLSYTTMFYLLEIAPRGVAEFSRACASIEGEDGRIRGYLRLTLTLPQLRSCSLAGPHFTERVHNHKPWHRILRKAKGLTTYHFTTLHSKISHLRLPPVRSSLKLT